MEENTDYLKLPVEEQCVHKVWKARLHGYEEAAKIFRQVDDEKSPEFSKYLGLLKKFVVDSNAVAQEKGLEAVLAFVENSALAAKTVGEVMAGIIAKCIAAPKAKTKELAVQITLMYIEIEKYEAVQEELLKGMEHKNPKTVAACVAAITEALREFGMKVINIKPLLKKIPVLLEDRDKSVREEGKALVIEMYRWIGVALTPQLSGLKPLQINELDAEFEKVKGCKVSPTRYLRSQQQKQAKLAAEMAAGDDVGEEDEEDGGAPEVDPYDLLDPVDILSKLPKDYYEKVEAKKWQDRKEAMESLEQLLQAPKLESGDYGDLIRSLKKIISKDANVMVVAIAGKCLASLAHGLKKRFQPYASQCIPAILEKFKEKKQNVVTALREAIDAIYFSTTIEAIQEDCLEALENKNPQVKAETASFLARCFTKCTPMMLTKKLVKAYTMALLKLLNDPDPVVRENSAEALGTAMKVVGEKAISPFLADIESIKMAKIKECCDKAVIVAKVPKVVDRPISAPTRVVMGDGESKPGSVKPVKRPASGAAKKAGVKKSATVTVGKKPAGKLQEKELSEEEVDEKLAEILPEQVVSGLEDANWKARLAAVEQFSEVVRDMDPTDLPTQVLLRALNKKPGLKDTNFQVLKVRLEAVKMLAEMGEMSSVCLECCLNDITDKLGDPKNGALAAEVLTALAESTKLNLVASSVLEFAFNQKNPKVQIEALNWVSQAIQEFGFVVQPKALMDNVKKAISATQPAVRAAGISFTGTLYLYMGQQLSAFFDGEKPAIIQQIHAEFEKHEGEKPPAPIRGLKKADGDEQPEEEMKINMQDLMEKVDISNYITESLLSELADKQWKVRSEALQKLTNILNENKCITSNLGELPPILAQRVVDSNSKIAAAAIALCQSLGTAMGSQCKIHVRTLFPSFLQSLGDSKVWIRSAALACINAWGDQCGYKTFFDGEMIGDALKSGGPVLRSELWSWLAQKLPDVPPKSFPREELTICVPHLFSNLEDRNAEVRKSAQEAVPAFIIHLGHTSLIKATEKLKPSTQTVITPIIMKLMGSVPVSSAKSISEDQEAVKTVKSGGAKAVAGKPSAKSKVAGSAVKSSNRKKDEEADTSPLLQANSLKNQRSLDEQKLKVLKWNFTTPREEFVELLKDFMTTANVNKNLMANMFHTDFKYHLKAIDMLNEDLPSNPNATVANLDLILKWMTLRFFDTNPSVLLKGLEYLNTVFGILIEEEYNMFDHEASSFVPYLILKIGDPKDAVRNSVRALFKQLERVYPASKLFVYTMDGLKSKNARQRTECLDLLGYWIQEYGLNMCQPTPAAALKEIARQISDRDNSVRNAALNCVVQAYFLEGEKVYKMIGQISDKDLSLLEERIKRAAKNRPPPGSRPPSAGRRQSPQQPQQPQQQQQLQKMTRQGSEGNINREPAEVEASSPEPQPQPRQTTARPRPVSGPFGLDPEILAKIEGKGISLTAPKLNEFDLKDILGDAPSNITKPGLQNTSQSCPVMYQPSQGRLPASYAHATHPQEVIEMGISNVAHPDVNVAWQACVQLELILQTDKSCHLSGKEDQLVLACVMQLRLLNSSSVHSTPGDLLCKGYRNLFLLLMSFFEKPSFAQRVSKKVLHDLVYQLLGLLVDRHLEELDNGEAFVRVVNAMVMRIIENADHTNITSAMIKSLHDAVASNLTTRFTELVMKCLWRITKLLPTWEEQTDFATILYEIHLFLKDFPSSSWKKRPSDIPLRTIKTLIHTITKIKGSKILNYMGRIDNASESELHSYLIKLIKSAKQDDVKVALEKKETKSPHRQAKIPYSQLSEIFKKIGTREHTKEGLSLLYDFKETYPQADIEPFLRKSSQHFQNYIAKGLKDIETERKKEQREQKSSPGTPQKGQSPVKGSGDAGGKCDTSRVLSTVNCDGDTNTTSKDAEYYLRRLQRLQADAGLQPANIPLGSNLQQQLTVSNDNITNNENLNMNLKKEERSEMVPVTRSSSDGVERLRRRLEAIKSSAK